MKTIPLAEMASDEPGSIAIGPFGSKMKSDCYVDDGVRVIRGTNITKTRGLKDDWVFVPEKLAETMPNCLTAPGDLVFPHRGAIGEVAIIEEDHPRMILSTSMMKFRPNPERADSNFLYYYFRSAAGRAEILKYSSQVGTPGIGQPLTSLRQFQVPDLPIETQQLIGKILSSLDDKIETNRRMNAVLEEMARAIFRAWFVDFEPVKARAAGATSFPGMPQEAFDQLPNRLIPSELGEIPEGWEVSTVADKFVVTMGQSPPSEFYNDTGEGLPFHQGVRYFGSRFPMTQVFCTEESRLAESRDVLLSVRAPVGRINVANRKIVIGRGLAAVKEPNGLSSFMLYAMKNLFAVEDSVGDGTIFRAITKRFLLSMTLKVPPIALQRAFEEIVNPLDDQILKNSMEIENVAALRDPVLPRLISGEIPTTSKSFLSRQES